MAKSGNSKQQTSKPDIRTLRVRQEGIDLYMEYAKALDAGTEIELSPMNVDQAVNWLDKHGHIKAPITREQVVVLFEMMLSGGTLQVLAS